MKRFFNIFILMTIMFSVFSCGMTWAEESKSRPYDDLLSIYQAREKALKVRKDFEERLLSLSEKKSSLELWMSLQDNELSDLQRSANGLYLIKKIFPGGSPARWEEVEGFLMPKQVPKSLVALDGVFYTVIALLNMNEEPYAWIGCFLMEELRNSRKAVSVAMRNAPEEYERITEKIFQKTGYTPVGGWPKGKVIGRLPFAHPVRGYITPERAMLKEAVFLNASGVKVNGQGPYAWDRKKGKIYNVILDEDFLPFWIRTQKEQ
ncbi:hypothetical protein Tlie_0006 [Thermovirga lienii DSM 17291]|uniref:Uncharacterized protein n=1 Tax=Thermovirga lienii (strain ATCC BAA-1197 / DSM 17291 / Cas60314) TaxID=580340 RepID=G7V552_THELD|nr:hypothetical protein [Thermovirga lienii]AER65752.1 hypothetical protein Tlie_0006 [Thermovirga lienii DSM 17291]